MTACHHTPTYPDLGSIPTLQEAMSHCSVVEDDEHVAKMRALTSADGGTTRVHAPYWRGLDDAQRAAVIAHERAHPAIGMEVDCEGCADKVGGYFMRAWGYAPPVVRSSFGSLSVQRQRDHGNIADNAFDGARAAERMLAGRGLLGKPAAEVSRTLLSARLPAPAPTTVKSAPVASLLPASPTVATAAARPVTLTRAPSITASPASPIQPAPGQGAPGSVVDPGGPGSAQITPAPEGTQAEPGPTDAPAPTAAGRDPLGDAVSAVLGEDARPHAGKVLIGMGAAAILAVVVVLIVRRSK